MNRGAITKIKKKNKKNSFSPSIFITFLKYKNFLEYVFHLFSLSMGNGSRIKNNCLPHETRILPSQ